MRSKKLGSVDPCGIANANKHHDRRPDTCITHAQDVDTHAFGFISEIRFGFISEIRFVQLRQQ